MKATSLLIVIFLFFAGALTASSRVLYVDSIEGAIASKKDATLVLNQKEMQKEEPVHQVLKFEQVSSRILSEGVAAPALEEKPSEEHAFLEELKKYIHFPETGKKSIGHLLINDQMIGQSTWIYVSSALAYYKESKPACIILELNTPGGEVFAAQRISDALKDIDTQYGIPVIAYINNWAISAGAMLAYSCRFIVASKGASMGGAEPVYLGAEGKPESASEKVNSVMRSDFSARAQFFDRNPLIAEAMVDKDIIIVLSHGKIVKIDKEDEIRKEGLDSDIIITPKGKLLTLNAKELLNLHVADFVFETQKLEILTPYEEESTIVPIAKTPFAQIPFFAEESNALIEPFNMGWQTRFLTLLTSPMVASVLLLILIIGAYIEFSTPGFGFPGTIALVSLFFILLSSYALEAVHWLELILLSFGIFLVVLEAVFFPTVGVLAVVGGVFIIVGLITMMIPGVASITFDGSTFNAAGEYVMMRLTWIACTILVAGSIIILLSRYITFRSRGIKRIVLEDTPTMGSTLKSDLDKLIGKHAVVTMTLRPAGRISVDGKDFDAISSGNYIEERKEVRIIRVEGSKIIVEELFL